MRLSICDRCMKKIESGSYDYKMISCTKYDGCKYCPVTYTLCKECASDFNNFMEWKK